MKTIIINSSLWFQDKRTEDRVKVNAAGYESFLAYDPNDPVACKRVKAEKAKQNKTRAELQKKGKIKIANNNENLYIIDNLLYWVDQWEKQYFVKVIYDCGVFEFTLTRKD